MGGGGGGSEAAPPGPAGPSFGFCGDTWTQAQSCRILVQGPRVSLTTSLKATLLPQSETLPGAQAHLLR